MNELLHTLMEKAGHDLETADRTSENRPEHTDIITFHCQQVVEKSLKAFLVNSERKIKRNHDILELLAECIDIDESFIEFKTGIVYRLDEIGVSIRYTDIEDDPSPEEASEFCKYAKKVYIFIKKKINIL
ncbi:MAG: HEPN domain-containing protein [Brevinematales bacterium]|nr:HEPN domain-containing protein [Brevinematales bacterium]